MSLPLPHPSNRLLRAATAEQIDLTRHRERLMRDRDQLATELRRVDDALGAVDDRLAILARLVDGADGGGSEGTADTGTEAVTDTAARDARRYHTILRGPAIRETAVQVLISQPEHIEALHYRRWYELLQEAGYAVAGKDPLAVFLTQVSRSPVVRKATEPGTYEVDRQAPLRLRQRLGRLQAELRELAVAPQGKIELSTVRARRHELDLEISQQERALEEALRVLRRNEPDPPWVSAVGSR